MQIARDAVFDDTEFMACFFGKMRRTSDEWQTKRSTPRLVAAMRTLCNLAAVDRRFRTYATAQLIMLLHEAQVAIQIHSDLAEAHLDAYYKSVNQPMANFARGEQAAPSRAIVEMVYGLVHMDQPYACPSVLDHEISFFVPRTISQLWLIVTTRSFVREELVEASTDASTTPMRIMDSSWYTHPYFDLRLSASLPNSFVSYGCYLPFTPEGQVVAIAFGRRKEYHFVGKRKMLKYEYIARPQVDEEPRPIDWHIVYLFRALRRRDRRAHELAIERLFERRDAAILGPGTTRTIPDSEIVIFHLPLLPFKESLLGLPDETLADIFGLDLEESIRLIEAGCQLSAA